MNIAITQPYIFPYIGYFNLIQSSDLFISLDDVQYISRGWINRNRILQGNRIITFTIPLAKAPRETPINQRYLAENEYPLFLKRFEKQLRAAYGNAPYFEQVGQLVMKVLKKPRGNMARIAEGSLKAVLEYIGIEKKIHPISKQLEGFKRNELHGQERLVNIAKEFGAKRYINLPGGKHLYSTNAFAEEGVDLRFIAPSRAVYNRPSPFVPNLSIIDLLMHLPQNEVAMLFRDYSLETQDTTNDR